MTAKKEYVMTFDALTGGLNIRDPDYNLPSSESPEMKNLIWRDGALNSRDGQKLCSSVEGEAGFAMHKRLWGGYLIAHIGEKLYALDYEDLQLELCSGIPRVRGTFFEYDGKLYYKSWNCYKVIDPDLTVSDVTPYVPVIAINCSPENGSGDLYQSENRLSPEKTVWYNAVENEREYYLPVKAESVSEITIDGAITTDYIYNPSLGLVIFNNAPPVYTPARNNTVKITYSLENAPVYQSIMQCRFAEVYGGTGSLCIVMAGSVIQPNAYYWNGNTNIAMDPGYFPLEQYQLAGDYGDNITAFGKQQNYLVVFKERSIGKTTMATEEIDEKLYIDMPYVPINAGTGCDLPWSVQLVENNLVWGNRERGCFILLDTTDSGENTVMHISSKIDGSLSLRKGLLKTLYDHFGDDACSCNNGKQYMLCAGGECYLWDYSISTYSKPSWFYWTNIDAAAFFHLEPDTLYLTPQAQLVQFTEKSFYDFGEAIEKVYRFATQIFGSYDRLKNIQSIIITTRSDTNSKIRLQYITDYENRYDLTDLCGYSYSLVPRDLSFRCLLGRRFAHVFRRKPGCRHIRHFTMRLENSEPGKDLSIVTAQVFFNYQGRERSKW